MQEGTTDRRGRLHSPQCTTSSEDRQIVRIRVVCPQDVHCLVYTSRRAADVSAADGVMKEGCGWQNVMKLSLLTSHAFVCNTTMVRFESGDTVREDAEQLAALCTATTLVLNRLL
ncbi:uncharacterized protein TNCV_209331 [Trichonephila clavipes]|uniref:Uncharacterized protein n=1 Tax=Trichonephila clavipes TaxID=2585209 RepID=A0A8X6T4Y4_TRICX|nr:uncharacterized protein TNCV_209331 [Trichonephila clavipes]